MPIGWRPWVSYSDYKYLVVLTPPKKGENQDHVSHVKKSKETKMEDILEERAEKCTAYDKNSSSKDDKTVITTLLPVWQTWWSFWNLSLTKKAPAKYQPLSICFDPLDKFLSLPLSEITQRKMRAPSLGLHILLCANSKLYWTALWK